MIVKCFECGHDVSTNAKKCPNCGTPYFLPPIPAQKLKIKCTLLNPSFVHNNDFNDGQYAYYKPNHVLEKIVDRTGDMIQLGGGQVMFCDNYEIRHGVPYYSKKIITIPGATSNPDGTYEPNNICTFHPDNTLGWAPRTTICGEYSFIPQQSDYQSQQCGIAITDTVYRQDPYRNGYHDEKYESNFLDSTDYYVTCIQGTEEPFTIYPSTTSIMVDVEIVKTDTFRSLPKFRKKGLLFADAIPEKKRDTIPVYKYKISKVSVS